MVRTKNSKLKIMSLGGFLIETASVLIKFKFTKRMNLRVFTFFYINKQLFSLTSMQYKTLHLEKIMNNYAEKMRRKLHIYCIFREKHHGIFEKIT